MELGDIVPIMEDENFSPTERSLQRKKAIYSPRQEKQKTRKRSDAQRYNVITSPRSSDTGKDDVDTNNKKKGKTILKNKISQENALFDNLGF